MFWNVVELFEQRKVTVGLDITHCTRITVPVPGATEIARPVYDADIFKTRLAEPGSCQQTTKTAADDDNFHLVEQWLTLESFFDIRIIDVTRILGGHLDVLLDTV